MPTPKPIIVRVTNHEDWEGIYIDGVLCAQDHRVSLADLAAALGLKLTTIAVSCDWLGDTVCQLPAKLEDIPSTAIVP